MKKQIKELEERIEFLEKQAAAGTATKCEKVQLKEGGVIRIDNVTEGHQFDGPATITILREIN